jgi:Flp pilus assembly pilin Flp
MWKLLNRLWHDELGAMAVDWAILASVLLLGSIAGLVALHSSVNAESQAITAPLHSR